MRNPSIPSGDSSGPLFPYFNSYLTQLREQGYARGSFFEQIHLLKTCDRWLQRTGRGMQDLNECVVQEFLRRCVTGGYGKNAGAATMRRLLTMLRRMGVTPEAKAQLPNPSEQLVRAYGRFLLEERNLSPHTASYHRLTARRFLANRFDGRRLDVSKLRAPDVSGFVLRHARNRSPSHAQQITTGLRQFLRYLHYQGLIGTDLSLAVPSVARWSLSTLPKHLSAAQVRQLLQHCDRRTPLGRRNEAILLLLARLGLRAVEVLRLQLDDLDWENGLVTVYGKGRWAQLPLPADAARAIARYLHRDRPRCACRRLFLGHRAPIGGLHPVTAISKLVRRALAKAGVRSARTGAHLLRHSLATEMLRRGASLAEIGEVLRHRSLDTTAIYAKVDLAALRTLALPWPGGVR
jgi:site-specific recombinase XerD